jgi:general secretion pathway protein G
MRARGVSGFTLIELMFTVAIMATLVAVAYPSYQEYIKRTEVSQATRDIMEIDAELQRYFTFNSSYPDSLADLGAVPVDPWGNPYRYLNIANVSGVGQLRKDHNLVPLNSDFDLYSMGEDGASVPPLTAAASRDDIVRGNNGGFVGSASDY